MADDNNFIPDDSELEFIKQEQDLASFNKGYDEPIDNRFLHNYIGGRQMGYGDDELKIIEDTAFSEIMDYMDANDIHYSEVDVYDFIPENKRLTPYLIFELGQRNEYYTNDLVEYMISVTRRKPSGIYDFDLDEIIDAPPSHYMAEYALKGADAKGPEQKLIEQAKIISGEYIEGDLEKLKFRKFFESKSISANPRDVKIKFVNNLFPGGSYEAYLEEGQRRAMEKMGMTPEGDWLPEVKENMIIKSTDVDGKVTYKDFYGKEVSPDDPRISDETKFDDLVKNLQTPPEELTEEQQIKKLYDDGIITETEYKQALNKEGNWADTPTNVVDDIKMKPIFTGTEAPPTGNSFVYADVEEIFDFVQFNRRNNPTQTGTTFSSDQIDAIKKTILEKGYIYDTGEFYNSAVVFPVSVDISGEIQIGEGNHRLLAAYEVAKETGQKIYVPIHVYTGGVVKGGQNQTRLVDRKNLYNALKELFKDVGASEYTINNKIGKTFDSVKQYGGSNYLGSGGSGGNSTSQENIKKFFTSIGVDTFTYKELPEDNVFKTGVNTLTDTPTNVVDDGPALLETRIENKAKTDRTTRLIPEWKSDVVKPNKIFAPNKMETNKTNISQGYKFRSGEEVLNAIKAGTATDEDITRFFIYLASKSPHKVYAYKPMSNADAVADIAKIGIFSERPLDELLPLTNKDPELTAKYNLVLDNDYVLRDLDRKIILDLINEQGQFNNLKERMRNTLIDAHNKIYAPNPNDYFFLWRGGGLSRFNTWQSFSKSMQSASGVMYQLKSTGIVPLEGGVNTYVINKNNMIDITNKIPFKLIELIKKMRYIFGDDIVLDKSLIADDIEDIYHYIIEKAYERSDYIFEELNFKDNAKQKLLVAFNKFFFDKFTI